MRRSVESNRKTMKTKDLLPAKWQSVPFFREETDMIENWNDVHIVPEFSDQGVDCYRLAGGSFVNEYYISRRPRPAS